MKYSTIQLKYIKSRNTLLKKTFQNPIWTTGRRTERTSWESQLSGSARRSVLRYTVVHIGI
jgi:hypothetical protein